MAVKVVSDKPVKTKRITCEKCGFELEYTGEDVTSRHDGDGDCTKTIKCPRTTCGETNYVKWP